MAKEKGGPPRRIGRAPALSIAGVVVIVLVGAIVWFRGSTDVGYRLRAETLVPTQLSVRPGDVECPEGAGNSPVATLDTGALADALPVYDGDLILVRVLVVNDRTSDAPIRFAARWPDSVVGGAPPACVFVVSDEPEPATLEWTEINGGIDISVEDAPVGESTELEIWLTAQDPDPGATFRTTITPDDAGDEIVVDPLGGRVTIDRRPGAPAVVSVAADAIDSAGRTFEVTATVSNATPRTRSLDVVLRLDTGGDPAWAVSEPAEESCVTGTTVECSLGDLAAGDVVEISATFTHDSDWEPAAVACQGSPSDLGFGLCVEALAVSLGESSADPAAASALVALPQPPTSGLTIGTDPDPVIARAGLPVEFAFILETATDDLGSINVVGSDCDELGRELNDPLEDGDAFLERNETWRYGCRVELEESTTFRFDVAAVAGGGQSVSTSFETTIRVVDPQLELTRNGSDGTILVTNSGVGTIRNIALAVPACELLAVVEGQTAVLDEGDTVELQCTSSTDLTGAIAYGTDELGLGVIGSFGP